MIESFQYPIGRFIEPEFIDHGLIRSGINDIEIFPSRLKTEVGYLSSDQLDTPYRPEGWTVRQVVHHCADSHINSFIRFKLTLTEDKPVIKPYFEYLWADLADSKMEIEPSLLLLEALHNKWIFLLRSLNEHDLQNSYFHPDNGRLYSLNLAILLYAWHCNHHLAHITTLKRHRGWN